MSRSNILLPCLIRRNLWWKMDNWWLQQPQSMKKKLFLPMVRLFQGTFPYRILSEFSVARDFDTSKDSILEASKATCLLFIQSTDSRGHLDWEFATAFFVGPNLLLTAGHNALNPRDAVNIERWIFSPGTPHLNIDQIASHEHWAIRCSVVENMYKPGEISKDIAILSSENFVVKHYLKISTDPVPEN